jgi:hypothetical protein
MSAERIPAGGDETAPEWGAVRFDPGARGGHVESYFVKANDPKGERALWLKWTIYASARAPHQALSEVWAIGFDRARGHTAVKTTVPWNEAQFSRTATRVAVDGCTLTPSGARGSIRAGDRRIDYDLAFFSDAMPLVHFPARWMYEGSFPASKLVSPIPDMRVRGVFSVGDDRWEVDAWPGLYGHNWGSGHAHLYGWGHCNAWDDAEPSDALVLEGVSARVRMGPALSPMTTLLCLSYGGVRHNFNAPSALLRNRGEITPRRWRFAAKSPLARIQGELWASTEDYVGLYYANPDGRVTHCLNTKLAHARLEVALPGRPARVFTSRAAALEIGTHDASHGVRMYV